MPCDLCEYINEKLQKNHGPKSSVSVSFMFDVDGDSYVVATRPNVCPRCGDPLKRAKPPCAYCSENAKEIPGPHHVTLQVDDQRYGASLNIKYPQDYGGRGEDTADIRYCPACGRRLRGARCNDDSYEQGDPQ